MEILELIELIVVPAITAIIGYFTGKKAATTATATTTTAPAAATPAAAAPIAALPTPVTTEPVKTTEGRLPDAKVTILGIYGDSAAAHIPGPSFFCDVNQVPELYADLQVLVTGSGFYSIFMDNEPLKDNAMQNYKARTIGEKIPISFWIPQKYRTPGDHILSIITGAETTKDFGLNDGKAETPVVFTQQNFGLKFTGVKAGE